MYPANKKDFFQTLKNFANKTKKKWEVEGEGRSTLSFELQDENEDIVVEDQINKRYGYFDLYRYLTGW